MPKITLIEQQTKNKNRCNLFVDGEFYAGVSVETIMNNRIKIGMEIDCDSLAQLIYQSERSDALNKAVEYISKSLKTKRQVKDYLTKKGYSDDIVWYCVDKLKEYNYIDDVEFSKRYISSMSKNNGKRLMEYKLMMKGVQKQDIEDAFVDTDIDAKENAKEIAVKYLRNKELSKENKAKAYRYLISKGFSYDEAHYALSCFEED